MTVSPTRKRGLTPRKPFSRCQEHKRNHREGHASLALRANRRRIFTKALIEMKTYLSLFAVALLAAPGFCQDAEKIVVPFDTIKSRHMIVDIMVNGKGPFTLVFDTGAPLTLVSAKLAQ